MRRFLPLVLASVLLAGCGGGGGSGLTPPTEPGGGGGGGGGGGAAAVTAATQTLGFPYLATKNTTRVPGSDPVTNASAVAKAVFPAQSRNTRPTAVALVDKGDLGSALAATVLAGPPIRAAILFTQGTTLPAESAATLAQLKPTGSTSAGNSAVIRVGDVATPSGSDTTAILGHDPFTLAAAIDRFQTAALGAPSRSVLVVSVESSPAFAMPAAAWAAKSGTPILLVKRTEVPPVIRGALAAHGHPNIYVLGPKSVVADSVVKGLGRFGAVTRIAGADPVANSIAFARYRHSGFGWGVTNPGHGMVFASAARPLDAVASASLSDSGTYGPLLVLTSPGPLSPIMADYLFRIQPAYRDPALSFYNHGWLIGDEGAITIGAQSEIDRLLETVSASAPAQ